MGIICFNFSSVSSDMSEVGMGNADSPIDVARST